MPDVEFTNVLLVTTIAAASVADFAAIVLLSSTSDASTGSRLVLLASFTVLVVTTAVVKPGQHHVESLDLTTDADGSPSRRARHTVTGSCSSRSTTRRRYPDPTGGFRMPPPVCATT